MASRASRAAIRDHSLPAGEAEPSAAFLSRAIQIACEAHAGQTDKAGEKYILHPLRVMLRMSNDRDRAAAVLHDVLEDCPAWSPTRLLREGIPPEVVLTVRRLTRGSAETYARFIERISAHPDAVRVKLADLEDNMDLGRLPEITDADVSRMVRYRKAVAVLQAAISKAEGKDADQ